MFVQDIMLASAGRCLVRLRVCRIGRVIVKAMQATTALCLLTMHCTVEAWQLWSLYCHVLYVLIAYTRRTMSCAILFKILQTRPDCMQACKWAKLQSST